MEKSKKTTTKIQKKHTNKLDLKDHERKPDNEN